MIQSVYYQIYVSVKLGFTLYVVLTIWLYICNFTIIKCINKVERILKMGYMLFVLFFFIFIFFTLVVFINEIKMNTSESGNPRIYFL